MKTLMKSRRGVRAPAAILAASVLLMAVYAGCGNGSNGDDVIQDVTVLDSNGLDTAGGDSVADTATDGEAGDVATDADRPDDGADIPIPTDIAADTLADTGAGDTGPDAVNPDECQVDQECDNCELCLDEGDGKKCVAVLWEQPECYNDDACLTEGDVCRYIIPGKPECGGSCRPGAVYTLHEWGVNSVTLAGGASMQAGPRRYYDSMDKKPVIYIYSDDQFTLDLGVEYRTGTSSETWPEIPASPYVV
mgnify:FL=1